MLTVLSCNDICKQILYVFIFTELKMFYLRMVKGVSILEMPRVVVLKRTAFMTRLLYEI